MSSPDGLIKPVVILVRPQLAENIGMCARAMANFGLSEMRLVAPRDGWPQDTRMKKGAYSAASGATHVLDQAKLFTSTADSIADLNHVYATTARYREQAKPVNPPSIAMNDCAARARAGQACGILFGAERTGLENDDIALASEIITFPVSPDFSSLNLAQAVLLNGYEWFRASQGEVPPFTAPVESPPATRAAVNSLFEALEAVLDRVGYFRPLDKKPVMVRNFRNMIHRMAPSEQDIRSLRGALDLVVHGGRIARARRKTDLKE